MNDDSRYVQAHRKLHQDYADAKKRNNALTPDIFMAGRSVHILSMDVRRSLEKAAQQALAA